MNCPNCGVELPAFLRRVSKQVHAKVLMAVERMGEATSKGLLRETGLSRATIHNALRDLIREGVLRARPGIAKTKPDPSGRRYFAGRAGRIYTVVKERG